MSRIRNSFFMVLVCSLATEAGADSCIRSAREVGKSKDGRFVVTAAFDRESKAWMAEWHDTKADKKMKTVLKGLQQHAHISVFVTDDGRRYAILDPSAGHRMTDRILVFQSDGTLVKSFGLKDVLKKDELANVSRSISHLSWVGYDEPNKRWHWLAKDGKTLEMLAKSGRKIQIPLTELMPEVARKK